MKFLGFSGSARIEGTTQYIIREILRGAKSSGAETTYYTLNELDFQGCQGCRKCKDEGICDLHDDLSPIYQEIMECDVLVLGSPVYMAYVTGQTKLFLDRLFAFTTREQVSRLPQGKKCILVFTQGYSDTEAYQQVVKSISSLVSRLGFTVIENLVVGGVYNSNDPAALEAASKAFELGQSVAAQ